MTNAGTVSITLKDEHHREETTTEIASRLQNILQDDDVQIEIANLSGSGGIPTGRGWSGRGIRISLICSDVEVLQRLTLQLEDSLSPDSIVLSVGSMRCRPAPEIDDALHR